MMHSISSLFLSVIFLLSLIYPSPISAGTVTYDSNGYKIDGTYRLLRGGSFQWFRIPPTEWRPRLEMFKASGSNIIDMYVAWNQHERIKGQFDWTTYNITAFLDLAKEINLFVYLRPGPYITNEMDGGGVPNWVFLNSTKKTIALDGRPNLRTEDPDWLNLCRHWYTAVNTQIAPYQHTRGGPIIFYAIENEYNWMRQFFNLDKAFWYDGSQERALSQEMNPKLYLTALRDIAKTTGIEVPITSCPGDGFVTDMGDVPDVLPMPNFYSNGQEEQKAYKVVAAMHDSNQFGGVYINMPSGTSETWRDPNKMKRQLMGGFDLFMSFNLFGIHNDGYMNGMSMAADLTDNLKVSTETWLTGFVSPQMSYFHSAVDYYGIVSSSGALRPHFGDYRRLNMLLNDFESLFASKGLPYRSIDTNIPQIYNIVNTQIGATEDNNKQVHYYMSMSTQNAPNCYWLEIVNEKGTIQTIGINGISFGGLRFPIYVPMTIPYYNDPSRDKLYPYAIILPINQPIYQTNNNIAIEYTTSEILTLRDFNDERMLVLYGMDETQGELCIYTVVMTQIITSQITLVKQEQNRMFFTYTYKSYIQTLTIRTTQYGMIRILIINTQQAGRMWFIPDQITKTTMLVTGLDYIHNITTTTDGVAFTYQAPYNATATTRFYITSPSSYINLQGHTRIIYDMTTITSSYLIPSLQNSIPEISTSLMNTGYITTDMDETMSTYDDSKWIGWTGDAKPIEALDTFGGHTWYRIAFNLTSIPQANAFCNVVSIFCNNDHALNGLYIEHASDIIGIYINGKYITTVLPIGDAIDAASINQRYSFESFKPYLVIGKNVLSLRVEIWGHGAFMFPRGNVVNVPAKFLPAAGFDSWRGIWGTVRMGPLPLTNFKFRAELGGERNKKYTAPNAVLDMNVWTPATLPLQLKAGDIKWYRVTVPPSALPDASNYYAPLVIELKGSQVKATIYFNGILIGRWLSDETWMSRGTWATGLRNIGGLLNVKLELDTFPMDRIQRQAGGQNIFSICFEDVSEADVNGFNHNGYGRVDSVRIKYNQEMLGGLAGQVTPFIQNIRAQGQARVATTDKPVLPSTTGASTGTDPVDPNSGVGSTATSTSTSTSTSTPTSSSSGIVAIDSSSSSSSSSSGGAVLFPDGTATPFTIAPSSKSSSEFPVWAIIVIIIAVLLLLLILYVVYIRTCGSKHVTTMKRMERDSSAAAAAPTTATAPVELDLTPNPAIQHDVDTLHAPSQV